MVDLPGLYKVTAKGRAYYYAWRGGPRIQADRADAQAFAREFAEHHEARKGGDTSRIAGLCVAWKASDAWTKPQAEGGMADSTKKNWRPWLDEIQKHFGALRVKQFERPEIRQDIKRWRNKWKDRPRTADVAKQVLSALLTYGVEEETVLASNPCFGIANLYANDRSELVWTDDDIMRLAGGASPEIMYALGLACLTGLRQSDLLKLSWSHVGELAIEIRTGKSGEKRTAVIPLYAELKAFLDVIPKRASTVLTNSDGLPWKSGFKSSFNKACWAALGKLRGQGQSLEQAGWSLHFHDARGTFATMAFELGALSVREIAEMLAWSEDRVEGIINRYVRKNALLRARIERMDRARVNTAGTDVAQLESKPGQA